MISKETLQQIIPNATERHIDLYWFYLNEAMDRYEINNIYREAAFIAQIAHETGSLRYMREIWGPTPTQLRYEGRKDLGNTQLGDGSLFRGRGAFQITGRANYKKYGDLLGVDLIAKPALAESPQLAFLIAGEYWNQHQLNDLADKEDMVEITRKINGGKNGLAEREWFYQRGMEFI